MAVNIDIEAVTEEEEMLLDPREPVSEVLKKFRKGGGLLSGRCQDLQRAAMKGDWEAAQEIFQKHKIPKTQKISTLGLTALHVAASCGRTEFVVKLVEHLDPTDLVIRDQLGRTALHHAALAAGLNAARALVEKNPNLPLLGDYKSQTPILFAALWRHRSRAKDMIDYLYKVTGDKLSSNSIYTGILGDNLVVALTESWCYDVALKILGNHPHLALARLENGMSILHVLAMQPSAFSDGSELSASWESLAGKKITKKETKQRREVSLKLVQLVCDELRKQSDFYIFQYFLDQYNGKALLHLAVEKGVFKMVEECLKYFPDLILYKSNNRTLLCEAIEHRQVEIFNHLIDLIGKNTKAYAGSKIDENGNNILHLTAQYSVPSSKLMVDTVPGPAFQMRRELQWYKAVEALVYEELTMEKNEKGMGQTPRELFFKEHKDLLKDAKEWMKDTSNSCMLVATLVATVAFAAMITVPGGNNSDTGLPVLSNKTLFVAFSISNALSMISSAVTLLMFLSVYTSRFTEKDFLDTFPKILLRGLIALFIAIATMMIAFGTAIGLALQRRVKWAYIPITVLACCPALIFTRLQLPLLFQTMVFESGPGIYGGQRDCKSWCLNKIDNISSIVKRRLL